MSDGQDRLPVVLIVDDEAGVRDVYRKYLEHDRQMIALDADCAEDAVRRLERVLPDVVLLDVALPDRSGLKLLEQMRRHPEWRRIPVLLLTGHDLAGLPEGAVAALSKPMRPEDVKREILAVLPPRRPGA